jgi:hypothetical protein
MNGVLGFYLIIVTVLPGAGMYKTEKVLGPYRDLDECALFGAYTIGFSLREGGPERRALCIDRAPDLSKGEQLKYYTRNELYDISMKKRL